MDSQDGDTVQLSFTTDGSTPTGTVSDTHTLISTDEQIGWPTLGLIAGGTTVKLMERYGRSGTYSNWSNVLTFAGLATWTPAAYFLSNTSGSIPPQGMFFAPSAATCFTDAGGTVAVTAIGQNVLYIKDKSGNGIDMGAVSTGATYQTTTGTFGTGFPYLQFNGTSDQYKSGAPSNWTFAQPIFGGHSLKPASTATMQLTDGLTSSDRCSLVQVNPNIWGMGSPTALNLTTTIDALDHIMTMLYNGVSSTIRKDSGAATLTGDAGTQAGTGITIGAAYQNSTFWSGRWYGGFRLYTNPSATLRGLLETWLTGIHP